MFGERWKSLPPAAFSKKIQIPIGQNLEEEEEEEDEEEEEILFCQTNKGGHVSPLPLPCPMHHWYMYRVYWIAVACSIYETSSIE